MSSAEKRARKTATPPKLKKPPVVTSDATSPQAPVDLSQPVPRLPFTVFKGAQWNIRGLAIEGDLGTDGEVSTGMLHLLDVLCHAAGVNGVLLQETWADCATPEFDTEHYHWYFSPRSSKGRSGVCIGIALKWMDGAASPKFECFSDRIIAGVYDH